MVFAVPTEVKDKPPRRPTLAEASLVLLSLEHLRALLRQDSHNGYAQAAAEAQSLAVWLADHRRYDEADHALLASLRMQERKIAEAEALLALIEPGP